MDFNGSYWQASYTPRQYYYYLLNPPTVKEKLLLDAPPASKQYALPSDPIDRFFQSKTKFHSRCVEDIVGLINERESIRYSLIQKIDYEYCGLKTRLHEIERFYVGRNPSIDKIRTTIFHELGALEKEKRMEEVACWRDIVRLKTELREALGELDREKRRDDFLQ